ncbi:site-2 protease family protein [Patescibacteria group bacterium]|nr:site-2 protease family protein [Patescibacteria group bacterium]
MILTIIVFLVILSILVLVHETGHFLVGKWAGVGVEEFALGLPFTKPILSKKLKDGMKISLYPLLFGGFVKLLGEENEKERVSGIKGKYFYQINVWPRIAVVLAGVTMNVFLALAAFYFFLVLSGFKVLIPKLADYNFRSPNQTLVVATFVASGSPADKAGLLPSDVLLSADGQNFTKIPEFQSYIKAHAGSEVKLNVTDSTLSTNKTVTVVPRVNPPAGQGALGIGIGEAVELNYATPQQKVLSGLSYAVDMFVYNFKVIGSLATAAFKTKNVEPLAESVSGPVGIASAVGSILDLGGSTAVVQLVNLLGLLSLSLAFMNVLPFPALDGGRFAFLFVEAVSGKKLPAKYENLINQIGMGILFIFIILVSFSDISKLFLSR